MDASLRRSARLAPFRGGISFVNEQEQRLPDLDFISIAERMLLQGKAVDVSAINAPAVDDAEVLLMLAGVPSSKIVDPLQAYSRKSKV